MVLHFSRDQPESDLTQTLSGMRNLISKMEQKILQNDKSADRFVETLSVEELKDLRQVVLASEYLLTKYSDRLEIKAFLEDFVGVMMYATNSVNGLQGDLEDLLISAEVALQQIQTLHHEMTHGLELGKVVQTRMDDFQLSGCPCVPEKGLEEPARVGEETGAINFTNTSRRIHTSDYLERTAVEI